jgi:hypothetical protein
VSSEAKTAVVRNKSERKLAPGPKRKALGDQLVAMSRDPLKFLLKIAANIRTSPLSSSVHNALFY